MDFRIAQISNDPRGVLTGAFVFSPPPHLPDITLVMVERFGAENTRLGPHGWAVDSRGIRPRLIEKRGAELWLCFGAEVSFHVLPNTPVRISIHGTDIEGTEIWPPIPRGKAPPADIPADDAPWPNPDAEPLPEPVYVPEPAPAPRPDDATIIVAPRRDDPPTPPPPAPPPAPPPEPIRRIWPLAVAALVLVFTAAGGAAWWFLRTPPPPVEQAIAAPPPPSPDCASAADVMSGKCTPDKMMTLAPAEQTRLAEALLALPDRRAGDMAISLLNTAASAGAHPPAYLALGRLYDPATFHLGGPLSAANPGRALALFAKAATGGLAEAATAAEALVARLKQEAAGGDAVIAGRARATLAAAGIP